MCQQTSGGNENIWESVTVTLFLSLFVCRLVTAKVTLSSSLTAMKWRRSLQRRWIITWWERDSSNVSQTSSFRSWFTGSFPLRVLFPTWCLFKCILFFFLPGQVFPPEKVHEKLFVGSERGFKKPTYPAVTRYNKKHTEEEIAKMTGKLLRKESRLRKRIAAYGIEYEFPGFVSVYTLERKH